MAVMLGDEHGQQASTTRPSSASRRRGGDMPEEGEVSSSPSSLEAEKGPLNRDTGVRNFGTVSCRSERAGAGRSGPVFTRLKWLLRG